MLGKKPEGERGKEKKPRRKIKENDEMRLATEFATPFFAPFLPFY